jgi:hypothetical protein
MFRLGKLGCWLLATYRHTHSLVRPGMLTHTPAKERFTVDEVQEKLHVIRNRLDSSPSYTQEEKQQLMNEVEQLSQFDLGRFLIQNGALSGWWTYYVILGHKHKSITNPVEKFIVQESPSILTTQERFHHFQSAIANYIKDHNTQKSLTLASIPGGMAADLLTLDHSLFNLLDCQLQYVNIDLDDAVFLLSQDLAKSLYCTIPNKCIH